MESLDPQRQDLIARIEAAFPDPGYPAEKRPTSCTRPGCEDCEDLDQLFTGRRWHEILGVPIFPDMVDAPALLSDEAFGYFIPALMIGCLRDPRAADITLDFVVYAFLTGSHRFGVLEGLSPEQRNTVYDFLLWFCEWDFSGSEWKVKLDQLVEQIPPDRIFVP